MSKVQWLKVVVVFEHGPVMELITDHCVVRRRDGVLAEIEWGNLRQDSMRPLHFGINHVIAVWVVDA